MSLDASTLQVIVKGDGITSTTDALNKLAVAGDKAEKSSARLAKTSGGADAAARAQAKVWYDLVDKVSKAKEREYNVLQAHNNKVYGLAQAEANRMNKQMDRVTQQDAANFARRRAQEQKQLQDLDVMRRNASAKEYARAQSDANKLNTMMDRQRKQQEAAAKASAERQRVLNASYSSASLAQQIATLQKAQAYSSQGGNASARYGSTAGSAASSGELTKLQQQYRQLQTDARRANATMADTHAAVRGLSGSLGALWLTYGNLLPMIAGVGIGMALKGIVAVGADIEHTLEKIRVLAGATTKEIGQMRDMVFELGKGVQGPQDVARAFSVLTLAGQTAKEAMTGVYATLSLATAGDVSIEKAATTLVQVSTSLGYTAADFEHIGDVVAKTAAVSMSSVESISGAFLSAAAVGEIYGASLRDIGTGLAAVANLGIQGTAAGTTLKNFYADLVKGSEKSTKALATMGLKIRDLKDDNGAMLDIVTLVTKLNDGLSKVNGQVRTSTQDAAFGERGVKTFAALNKLVNTASTELDQFGNVYKNRLVEISGEIERSAAFATTAALAMTQTSTNQMKSVGNTLQVVLGKAFASIAPQIGQVARALKAAFNSPEFLNGVKTVALMVANLTVFIVEHAKQIGIMVAAYAGWKIGVFAAGLITMAKSFDIAKVAARGFSAALGPLGLAITALGVAWELYGNQKNKAITDNDANAGSLEEYAKGLKEAAAREAESLALRRAGVSETDVLNKERIANDKATSAKLVEASADGVREMKKSLDAQYTALNDNEKKRSEMIRKGQTQFGSRDTVAYVDNLNKYMAAYNKHLNTVKEVAASEKSLFEDRQENGKLAEKAAKDAWIKPTGDGDVMSDGDAKAAKKAINFIQNEALELNKLTATYEAKNAAMRQSIELGKHVAAEAQQAIVMENLLAGKYGSKSEDNALYQAQMRLALAVDEAKAENEKLKKVNEFATKLAELEAAQKAYNTEAMEGSLSHFGALRKEAEGLIQVVSMSEKAAEALRNRADAMDAYKKQQEAIVKLNSAADSSRNRAAEALEEAETMKKYGEVTKLGAIAVAQLVIEKSKLNEATGQVAKSTLLEVAATEQLNTAYRDLIKQQIEVNKAAADAQAEGKLIFANSEADKVAIANETRKKLMAIEYQKVQDAYTAKESLGKATPEDFSAFSNAYNTYIESVNKSDQVASMETNNLKLKDWKKTIDDVEQIGREGFYNLTEEGVGLWKSMASTFKSMFKTTVMDYIYKEFAKPLVLKVVASLAGMVGADGLSQAANAMGGGDKANGASGIMSAVNTAKTLYSTITGGFAAVGAKIGGLVSGVGSLFGSASVSAFGAGMGMSASAAAEAAAIYNGAGMASTGSALTAGSTAGSVAGIAAGLVAGHFGGRAISGGYSAMGGSGNGLVNTGTAAGAGIGAIFGGPLGSAIGAAIGGIAGGAINRLFGRKAKEVESEGIRGTVSSNAVSGEGYSNWLQKGGIFRSDKRGTDTAVLGGDISNSLMGGFNALKSTTTDFAKNLGVSSDALVGYSKQFNITLTKDAAKNEEALAKFFTDMGDEMATKLVPNIMSFAKQGETAAAAMERLSGVFEATKGLADILGKSISELFGAEGMDSAKARTMLVDLSGGVDALSQKTSAYVSAIYTDAEKLAPVQKALADTMSELGLSGVTTKEQFRAVVEAQKLTDEASIKTFNTLLELAPIFGQVADAAEAAKTASEELAKAEATRGKELMSQRLTLEGQIAELTNNSAEASRVLAAQRAIELAEMDNSLKPLQERVWLLEDEAKRIEKNSEIMEKAKEGAESALSALSAAIDKEKDNIDKKYEKVIASVNKAAEASVNAAELQKEAAEKQRDIIKGVLDDINNALKSTQVESFELTKARRAEAQSYLAVSAIQARSGGSVGNMAGLGNALEAISKPSEDLFGSFEDYARDQAMANHNLSLLQGAATTELTLAELTIERLSATIDAIQSTAKSQIEAIEKTRDAEKESLDNMLIAAQQQLDALNGINNSVMSVVEALNSFNASMASVRATEIQQKTGNNGAAIDSLYKDVLGRGADSAGKEYWTGVANSGTSIDKITSGLKDSQEYKDKALKDLYQNVLGRPADAAGLAYWKERMAGGISFSSIEDTFRNSAEYYTNKGIASYDVGTDFVPKDGIAMIHRGEMITPATDASAIRRQLAEGGAGNSDEMRAELQEIKQAIMSGDLAVVQKLAELLRIEKKWDTEGQPEIRNVELNNAA